MTGADYIIARTPDGWHARRPADGWSAAAFPTYAALKEAVDNELMKLGPARGTITTLINPGQREACDEPRAG